MSKTYTLENYLVGLHTGAWFGFNNLVTEEDKTYANLVIHSDDAKPTEQECINGVAQLQADYNNTQYSRSRATEYAALNQFEMQFDDQQNNTTTWVDAINDIKARFPK